jgi:hypothetical protein
MAEPLTSQAWVAARLQKASHDLETAERALYAGHPITDTAAYHCHQAVEKALKAFLASRFEIESGYSAGRRDNLVKQRVSRPMTTTNDTNAAAVTQPAGLVAAVAR